MRKCPVCGFANTDSRQTCLKCSAALVGSERVRRLQEEAAPRGKASAPRGETFAPRPKPSRRPSVVRVPGLPGRWVGRVWRRIVRALAVPVPEGIPHRFPLLAGFLGLAPGLGQLYNRQPRKTLYLVVLFAVSLTLTVRFILAPYIGSLLIAATILVSMVSFADAMITAARINGQYFTARNVLALLTYPICLLGLVGIVFAVLSFFGFPVFTLFAVRYDYMAPSISLGDRVCGEKISYWFREPRPGDVVRYDPPGFRVELPNPDPLEGDPRDTAWEVDPVNGWERILAVGGETLECRDGLYTIDGRDLSEEYYPLLTGEVFRSFRLTCPEGKLLVLMSSRPSDPSFINRLRDDAQRIPGVTTDRYKGDKYATPPFDSPGIVVLGWEEACFIDKSAILDRAWFRYYPGPRRRFFQAKGPRFAQ